MVDLVKNLQELAEDQHEVLKNLAAKVKMMDKKTCTISFALWQHESKKNICPINKCLSLSHVSNLLARLKSSPLKLKNNYLYKVV